MSYPATGRYRTSHAGASGFLSVTAVASMPPEIAPRTRARVDSSMSDLFAPCSTSHLARGREWIHGARFVFVGRPLSHLARGREWIQGLPGASEDQEDRTSHAGASGFCRGLRSALFGLIAPRTRARVDSWSPLAPDPPSTIAPRTRARVDSKSPDPANTKNLIAPRTRARVDSRAAMHLDFGEDIAPRTRARVDSSQYAATEGPPESHLARGREWIPRYL